MGVGVPQGIDLSIHLGSSSSPGDDLEESRVRGRIKKKKIKEFISSNHLDFIAIQESKLELMSDYLCHFLWGNSFCDWSFTPAIANSGGILSIWCGSRGKALCSFSGSGFVGVCLDWGVSKIRCFMVNVYSKCSLAEKKAMWSRLLHLRDYLGGDNWCVVGDFNSVLSTSERRGYLGISLGERFTWFQPNGGAMSRLDRFPMSDGWWDLWGEPSQWALPRDVSDHCPIILRYSSQLWGPKPFRFNNFWLDHRGLRDFVTRVWCRPSTHGWMAYRLKEKLKALKGDLKIWNHEVFGNLDYSIELVTEVIKDLDLKAERGPLSREEIDDRSKGFTELWRLLKCRDSQMFQRSRSRWLKEGDANTGFYHASVKRRGRRNSILALRVGDRWLESVSE
ncbi:cytochrome P450, partial [Trifolium medium]|nr:cytochrome P450 [Trifolium medium]